MKQELNFLWGVMLGWGILLCVAIVASDYREAELIWAFEQGVQHCRQGDKQ